MEPASAHDKPAVVAGEASTEVEAARAAADSWELVPELAGPRRAGPEAQPQAEPAKAEDDGPTQLDLCFLCDCTGSMGKYIASAQQNIRQIVERVAVSEKADVRFALISYRDHPPQERTYVTKVFPFTAEVQQMKSYVDSMSAHGGGDGPEAVTAALHDALVLPWRPNGTKVAVLIADAPPHGLEPSGDGFPNGDPEGRDPLEIARQMAAHGITCYAVGCEPALGTYRFARDFMCALAEETGGQAVALGSAALLAEVIVNGSAEEISMTRLQREVELELEQVQAAARAAAEAIDERECARRALSSLQARSVKSKQMQTDGAMKNAHHSAWHKSDAPQTLASAKAELCAAEGVAVALGSVDSTDMHRFRRAAVRREDCPRRSAAWPAVDERRAGAAECAPRASTARVAESAPASCKAATSNVLSEDLITEGQVSRIMKRAEHRSKASKA